MEPDMITIPTGPFIMGAEGAKEECPPREIFLDEYELAKYPVTNLQYEEYLKDNPEQLTPSYWDGRTAPSADSIKPVVQITWHEARAYAAWLSQTTGHSYRLPTEAEWEKAARGTDGRVYPWGKDFDSDKCNTREKGPGTVTPVEHYPKGESPYGLMDMSGNAGEWCTDWYQEGYSLDHERNPPGPNTGTYRVVRGGSWRYSANAARCAARYWCPPDLTRDNTGLRLAKS